MLLMDLDHNGNFLRVYWNIKWSEYFTSHPESNIRSSIFDKTNKSIYKSIGSNRYSINSSQVINIKTFTMMKKSIVLPIENVYLTNCIE